MKANGMTMQRSSNDISLLTSLLLGVAVIALFFGLKNYRFLQTNWKELVFVIEQSQTFLVQFVSAMVFNLFVLSVVFERAIGFKKQGSRLRSIKKNSSSLKGIILKFVLSLFVSLCC